MRRLSTIALVALATLSLSVSGATAQKGPFNANKPKGLQSLKPRDLNPESLQPKGLNTELFPNEPTSDHPIPGKNATGAAKKLMSSENEEKFRALQSDLSAEDRIALDQKLSDFNKKHPDPEIKYVSALKT